MLSSVFNRKVASGLFSCVNMEDSIMIIYKITNKINGKIYIGLSRRSLEKRKQDYKRRYLSQDYLILRAMKKHGFENFIFEEIDNAKTINELSEKEKYWIKFYNSRNKRIGYNILEGGIDETAFYWRDLSDKKKEKYSKNMSKILQGRHITKHKKSSKYIGVTKHRKRWVCQLKINKKHHWQSFVLELDAAITYDKMVVFFYKNGILNFPEKLNEYKKTNWKEFWIMINKKLQKRGVRKPIKNLCKCGKLKQICSKNCSVCGGKIAWEKNKSKEKMGGYNKKFKPETLTKEHAHWLVWNESIKNICKLFNVCSSTFLKWIAAYNIKRPNIDSYWILRKNGCIIDYQI